MMYGRKWHRYASWWDAMVPTDVCAREAAYAATIAVNHKARYVAIQERTGVPWWLLAALHRRESNADFGTYLGNGEVLTRPTRLVPKGRGPFTGEHAFEDGAVDALHIDRLDAVHDWRLEKALYYCELFNGTGYDLRGLPSPYLWGGTNIQVPGKYVGDHKWNAKAFDKQLGCAPIIAALQKIDSSIILVRET